MNEGKTPDIIDLPRSEYSIDGQPSESKEVALTTSTERTNGFMYRAKNTAHSVMDWLDLGPFDYGLLGTLSIVEGIIGEKALAPTITQDPIREGLITAGVILASDATLFSLMKVAKDDMNNNY